MDETHNTNTEPSRSAHYAEQFFASVRLPLFTNQDEALGFIRAVDRIVDVLQEQVRAQEAALSDKAVRDLGSALGEAFRATLGGVWRYSPKQGRWVIAGETMGGDRVEFNVFNKLEKRLTNGMEDSIEYFFDTSNRMVR